MNVEWPENNFLQQVQNICRKNGTVFILDEMVTGFRFADGGAQEYFNIIPDLTCLGKGMGNGYPISAVVGKRDIMKLMEDVFFSFTFGGETLSMAASLAVLEKYQKENVTKRFYDLGEMLIQNLKKLIEQYSLERVIKLAGHPAWSFILFQDTETYTSWELKTLYMQEMMKHGVLIFGIHNLSYAHTEEDVHYLLSVYDGFCQLLSDVMKNKTLNKVLLCTPLKPLFKVR